MSQRQRRHISSPCNRALAVALLAAVDRLAPAHPNYAFWRRLRPHLAVLAEVAW